MKHADLLAHEDMPSQNPAARIPEPWWRPRHRMPGRSHGPDGARFRAMIPDPALREESR